MLLDGNYSPPWNCVSTWSTVVVLVPRSALGIEREISSAEVTRYGKLWGKNAPPPTFAVNTERYPELASPLYCTLIKYTYA